MSHTSTHPTSQQHHLTVTNPHKDTIRHFTDALNENHLNKLEKYLENNVQKTLNSQVVYKDLKEAHDYYTKEHENSKTSHWKVLNYHDDNQPTNTIKATVTHNDKIYDTTYTFSTAGKIQHIQATLHENQNQSTTDTNKH